MQVFVAGAEAGNYISNDSIQPQGLEAKRECPALQTGGFQHIIDQQREPIGFLIDDREKFLLGFLIPRSILP